MAWHYQQVAATFPIMAVLLPAPTERLDPLQLFLPHLLLAQVPTYCFMLLSSTASSFLHASVTLQELPVPHDTAPGTPSVSCGRACCANQRMATKHELKLAEPDVLLQPCA